MSTRNKKLRHDTITILLHWQWCKIYRFDMLEKYYDHFVEKEMRVLKNDKVKILWDFSIQTETKINHKKAGLILLQKKNICYIVDVVWLFDPQIEKKEKDMVKSYTDLKYEILKM